MRPQFEEDKASVATVLQDYDAAKHTPVFYGSVMHKRVSVDLAPETDFDAARSHPACVGFAFVSRPPLEKVQSPSHVPDSRNCKQQQTSYSLNQSEINKMNHVLLLVLLMLTTDHLNVSTCLLQIQVYTVSRKTSTFLSFE